MRHLAIIIACLVISACADLVIRTDYQPGTDYSLLKSYAWLPDIPLKTGNPALDSSLMNNRIRNALERSMYVHGFHRVEPDQADVYLAYYLTLESRIESFPTRITYYGHHRHGKSFGYSYGYRNEIQEYQYNTLYIDLISPTSEQTLWRGSAESLLQDYTTPEQREQRINEVVARIMQEYPPGRKPAEKTQH